MKLPKDSNSLLQRNVLLVLCNLSAVGALLAAVVNIIHYTDARLPVVLVELCFTTIFSVFAWWAYKGQQKNWHSIAVIYGYIALIFYAYCLLKPGNTVIQWWFTIPLISFLLLERRHSLFLCSFVFFAGSALYIYMNIHFLARSWSAGLLNLVFPYLIISLVANTYERMRLNSEQSLLRLALTDPLTGALNRKGLNLQFEKHIQTKRVFSLALLDIDRFKSINDNYGHNAGDRVLIEFTRILAEYCEPDHLFRLGGEEFVMLLNLPVHEARPLMDELREEIASTPFRFETRNIHTSFSGGVCENRSNSTLLTMLQCADKLLYQAKSAGRNKVLS